MKKIILVIVFVCLIGIFSLKIYRNFNPVSQVGPSLSVTITPTVPTPTPLPDKIILVNDYQIFQTFNNCGPAALSMALSYYGINKSQKELGQELRPYQIPKGNNDDKSVTLEEMAQKAQEFNLIPYHRPNGTIEVLQKFIAIGIPIITRTRLTQYDDIGHYRVIKGYDSINREFNSG